MGVDKNIIAEKLKSLERYLERIKFHTPLNADGLKSDLDKQDLICLNLQRAVQISVDIASHILSEKIHEQAATMSEVFLALSRKDILDESLAVSLAKSVGFRNIAVHEYNALDMDIVYSIITNELNCFYKFANTVLSIVNNP